MNLELFNSWKAKEDAKHILKYYEWVCWNQQITYALWVWCTWERTECTLV